MAAQRKYPKELRERAVKMVSEILERGGKAGPPRLILRRHGASTPGPALRPHRGRPASPDHVTPPVHLRQGGGPIPASAVGGERRQGAAIQPAETSPARGTRPSAGGSSSPYADRIPRMTTLSPDHARQQLPTLPG
jgi:hypothetical protein